MALSFEPVSADRAGDPEQRARLTSEATYLARQVFGVDLAAALAGRYADAHQALHVNDAAAPELAVLARAITEGADIEALEFALRRSKRRNAVTQKLHILGFLIESDPALAGRFVNETPSRARAVWLLFGHGLRAAWKYVVGRRLLARLHTTHA